MHCITQSALKLSSPSICHPIKSFISLRQTHLSHFTPPVSHWPLCSVCLTQLWQWLQAVGRTNNPRRLFKEEWRRLYPLAQYCAKQMKMFCQVCREAGVKNNLGVGIEAGTDSMSITSLKRHFELALAPTRGSQRYHLSHQHAMTAIMLRAVIQPFALSTQTKQMRGILSLIITAYNLIAHRLSIPIHSFGPIMETQRMNGAPDIPIQHCDHNGASESLLCIEAESDACINHKMKQASVICVGTDEMSDKGAEKPYVFVAAYVYQGDVDVVVLKLADPKTAQAVADHFAGGDLGEAAKVSHKDVWDYLLKVVFAKRGIDITKKLGLLNVDGAMMDMEGMLKSAAPQAILHWDGGHRWALRLGDVYSETFELEAFDEVQQQLFAFFGPGKGLKILNAISLSLGLGPISPNKLDKVRWTGRDAACKSELKIFTAACTVLSNQSVFGKDAKKRSKAAKLLERVANLEHVVLLCGMGDLLHEEMKAVKMMQIKLGSVTHIKTIVKGHTKWLEDSYIKPTRVLAAARMGELYHAIDNQVIKFDTLQFKFRDIPLRAANMD